MQVLAKPPRRNAREGTPMIGEIHCFGCGQPGHIKAECPHLAARRHPPAPPPPSAPDRGNHPPPFNPYWLRDPSEIADPGPWANQIRAANGWENRSDEEGRDLGKRARAAEQVAESRAATSVSRC
jgi:hypothetical protein